MCVCVCAYVRVQKKMKKRMVAATTVTGGAAAGAGAGVTDPAIVGDSFYRFQVRETKRQRLAELRRKFEEDKERLDRLKAARSSRKFKPM